MKKKSSKSSFWSGFESIWDLSNFKGKRHVIRNDYVIVVPSNGLLRDANALRKDALKARRSLVSELGLKEIEA